MPQVKRPLEPGTSSSAGEDACAATLPDLSFDDSEGESADEDPEQDLGPQSQDSHGTNFFFGVFSFLLN